MLYGLSQTNRRSSRGLFYAKNLDMGTIHNRLWALIKYWEYEHLPSRVDKNSKGKVTQSSKPKASSVLRDPSAKATSSTACEYSPSQKISQLTSGAASVSKEVEVIEISDDDDEEQRFGSLNVKPEEGVKQSSGLPNDDVSSNGVEVKFERDIDDEDRLPLIDESPRWCPDPICDLGMPLHACDATFAPTHPPKIVQLPRFDKYLEER